MAKTINVVINHDQDERVIQEMAAALRANTVFAKQIRVFAETMMEDNHPQGLRFEPRPGMLLACHFGLGFQEPEIVKTRPVIVISPKQRRWSKLCTVIPISSKAPYPVEPYHYKLPDGVVPDDKYKEAWIKGDLVQTVGCHRLDRFKTGFRKYEAPVMTQEVLREVRRCVLHATGMHALTEHW